MIKRNNNDEYGWQDIEYQIKNSTLTLFDIVQSEQ